MSLAGKTCQRIRPRNSGALTRAPVLRGAGWECAESPWRRGETRGKGSVEAAQRIFSCQQCRVRPVPPGAGHRGVFWLLTGRMEIALSAIIS